MWGSRKEATVALSTSEAEYVSGSEATKEILWIRQLSMELGICEMLVPLYVDNKSAVHMIKNNDGKSLKRTKHIDIKFHYFRESVDKDIEIHHIDGNNQNADIFTKLLPFQRFSHIRNQLGISCITEDSRN
ncbi:hypothetical protein JTB14_013223 [Gonioctena quinquepunctata]|nr:hypothetical protein JTB14_013223 [Gonioctena quinquepunctata]